MKKLVKIILILLLIFLFIFSVNQFISSNKPNIKFVKISGIVFATQKQIDMYEIDRSSYFSSRPIKIDAYFYELRHKPYDPTGDFISRSEIKWLDDFNGTYEFQFKLPIGSKIVLESKYSNYITITIEDREIISQNIPWEEISIKPESSSFDIKEEECHVKGQYDGLLNQVLDSNNINETERKELREQYIVESNYKLQNIHSISNTTEKLKELFYIDWTIKAGRYKLFFYELGHCIDEVNELIKDFNPRYFVLGYFNIRNFNRSYNYYTNNIKELDRVNPDFIRNFNDLNLTYIKIGLIERKEENVRKHLRQCEDAEEKFKKDYEFQYPRYIKKISFLLLIIFLTLIFGLYLGYKLNKFVKNIINLIKMRINFGSNKFKEWVDDKAREINLAKTGIISGGIGVLNTIFIACKINILNINALFSISFLFIAWFFLFLSRDRKEDIKLKRIGIIALLFSLLSIMLFYHFVLGLAYIFIFIFRLMAMIIEILFY